MSSIEHTLTVGEGGKVAFQIARPVGSRIRVIVCEEDEATPVEAIAFARLQESNGFAHQVLADPAEDVWNDL